MIRTVEALAERNMAAAYMVKAASSRPRAHCPEHPEQVLDEGPTQYRCPRGHRVQAADLDREVTR